MRIDDIGRLLRTNNVEINSYRVRKKYRPFAINMVWGPLERKPFVHPKQRYKRQKRLIKEFFRFGLNTPDMINEDETNLVLEWKTLELTDFVQVFRNPRIHFDDKLQYFKEGLEQLFGIHNLGETHGDPYPKNFFLLTRENPGRGRVYTCDFENYRISPDPQITDLLLFVAGGIHLLDNSHSKSETTSATFKALEEVYGKISRYSFDTRDRFFYRARFGMKKEFFDYF